MLCGLQEDTQLGKLVQLHGNNWAVIAKVLGHVRTPRAISVR
ncbi:hypothetical protein EON65_45355 [archaeon]|nr:MAG: hypothetical protein EON65_45355 [archaeon]